MQENSGVPLAEGVTLSGVPEGRGLYADVTLEKLDSSAEGATRSDRAANLSGKRTEETIAALCAGTA